VTGRTAAVVALALLFGERAAHAGRSHFGWLYDTETVPERGVELEQWLSDQHRQGSTHRYETSVWWGPVIGITDQVELALPIEWTWTAADDAASRTTLARFGGEVRWRLVTADPVDAPAWVPLVRLAIKRPVFEKEAAQVEADAVLSFDCGRVHAVADAGFYDDIHRGDDAVATHSGVGVSVALTDELRAGAEAYVEASLTGEDDDEDWATVGPNLAWTHGRFWLTASLDIGVYQIQSAPRIKWGVAF
jgi:hypothetical protein